MDVSVIGGAGYVGLITGVGLAEIGHQVVNVDVDRERLGLLRSGRAPFYEEGLEPLLARNIEAGRLRFSDDVLAAAGSEVVFIAVGTPSLDDGRADLSQVIEVAKRLSATLEGYTVVVIKSTVPVGTVEMVRDILRHELAEGQAFDVAYNPEFLREGMGLQDFFFPDRIVIGTCSDRARDKIRTLYKPLLSGTFTPEGLDGGQRRGVPVIETDLKSGQMIKYASNAMLATRISFINEIAGICDRVGADIQEVARGMSYDHRIGRGYLGAGLGFGGPCLEKDLRALIHIAEVKGYSTCLLRAVLDRNELQAEEVMIKLKRVVGDPLYRKVLAIYGLAFKAGTNDVRNSLSLRLIDRLEREGVAVRAHDPVAIPEARALRPGVTYCDDPYEAVRHADALLLLTDWPQYRDLNYQEIRGRIGTPCVVDARNLADPAALRALGFTYMGVGRR